MSSAEPRRKLDRDAYLAMEQVSESRHEFVAGEIFAMAGASRVHARVVSNLDVALQAVTASGPCEAFVNDVKVRVDSVDAWLYPDVVVTCDPADRDPYVIHAPSLVIEVLSPSTASNDKGLKLDWYRSIPSLREYALVDTERRSVHLYRREGEGWSFHAWAGDETAELSSVGTRIALSVIYARVTFEEEPPGGAAETGSGI